MIAPKDRKPNESVAGHSAGEPKRRSKPVEQNAGPAWHALATGGSGSRSEARVQAKLAVNRPGDDYEKEADRIADQVMTMPESEGEPTVQRKINRPDINNSAASQPEVGAANRIGSLRNGGEPMPDDTRSYFEARFGADFSGVRVHRDEQAAESASGLNALAFTVGQDIVFGKGQYAPGAARGKKLLAHELVHVLQQREVGERVQRAEPAEATNADRREFVQETIHYLNDAADYFRMVSQYDHALVERVLDGWNSAVTQQESIIVNDLQGDQNLIDGLRQAYLNALHAMVGTAAGVLNLTKDQLLNRNSGRIPGWVWPHLVEDRRARVLPAEAAMLSDLLAFLRLTTGEIRTFAQRNNPAGDLDFMVVGNANVDGLLNLLDTLISDLDAGVLIVRFDQPAGGNAAASYEHLENVIHLRQFANDEEMAEVAAGMVHEFTHVLQDRIIESQMATNTGVEHTAGDEIQKEVDARRRGTYYVRLIDHLGHRFPNPLGGPLTARGFVSRFERERQNASAADQAAAIQENRQRISNAYSAQIARNAPIIRYRVVVDSSGQIQLLTAGGQVDLGSFPHTVLTSQRLAGVLGSRISSLPDFNQLFDGPNNVRYNFAFFYVYHGDRKVAEFGLAP